MPHTQLIRPHSPFMKSLSCELDYAPILKIGADKLILLADIISESSLVAPADRQHVVELAPQTLHRRLEHAECRHRPPESPGRRVHPLVKVAKVNEEQGEELWGRI